MTNKNTGQTSIIDEALDSITYEVVRLFKEVAKVEEIISIEKLLEKNTRPKYETTEELVRGVTKYLAVKIERTNHKIVDHERQIKILKTQLKSAYDKIDDLIEASETLQESANSFERSEKLLRQANSKFEQINIENKQIYTNKQTH